jgi:multidrug efflux pump subunit AcrB
MAVGVILLVLAANFQSLRLALAVGLTIPAVIAGVVLMLWLTRTTLNIQSFMGAIMAIGVAVANAILLVTFAERSRVGGREPWEAAIEGARSRLRPILMTSFAMLAGMMPMAALQSRRAPISASLDPDDPHSRYFESELRFATVSDRDDGRAELHARAAE